MRFRETRLEGAWLIEPTAALDDRGSFMRTYCEREFAEQGLETRFVQHSQSHSVRRGTLRGLHLQLPPHGEVKLVSCIRGTIIDIIVDLRSWSPTRYEWIGYELSAENRRQIYIPKGFAHGFQTVTDDAMVSYLISEFYVPDASVGLRYDDPLLAIDWPLPVGAISQRDQNWPLLGDLVPG
nr:dTDP-4-dehydrorhamnose 3,5-epimerase [Pararhizobium haloflavum]